METGPSKSKINVTVAWKIPQIPCTRSATYREEEESIYAYVCKHPDHTCSVTAPFKTASVTQLYFKWLRNELKEAAKHTVPAHKVLESIPVPTINCKVKKRQTERSRNTLLRDAPSIYWTQWHPSVSNPTEKQLTNFLRYMH
jgi:hypothetical protein